MTEQPIRTGIVGLGRAGWDIHANLLRGLPERYAVVAVADPEEGRLREAAASFGCRTYRAAAELFADPEVELAVIAVPSFLHAKHTIAALRAGKAVVSDKPMAANLAEADAMLAAARETGRLLTVFHNRRYEASFQQVQAVLAAGKLGRIVEIKMTVQSFARRWDWQTLRSHGGGMLRNAGAHFIDLALQLMGPAEPRVTCRLDRALTLGDAEDHVKLILDAPGAPLVDLELTSACSYPQEHYLIMGTRGTLAGGFDSLRWQYLLPEELTPRVLSAEAAPNRAYPIDDIRLHEETWSAKGNPGPGNAGFYLDLYNTLRAGATLAVTPESSRRVMWVIEECERQQVS
jgi:scyllo-inositol 2-dehydrogenase (NADP+)